MTKLRHVRKRDGVTLQEFDINKILAAARGAWTEVRGKPDGGALASVVADAERILTGDVVDVESVQDAVEVALMRGRYFDVAKAFVLHRHKRAEARDVAPDPEAISQYIHASKYARWREDLGRRELRDESVDRVRDMHLRRWPELTTDIEWAFGLVRDKRVLPSQRTMQFAGQAIEAVNARSYNCSFSLIDRVRAFSEAFYLLLCGCGVGYSVQFAHVDQLPVVEMQTVTVVHRVIEDTIEGWANAAHDLVDLTMRGLHVEFAYNLIRDRGAPLKTSGGRAPGHLPLRTALERVREILLAAQGRKLRPIDCHRILCHFADAVLAGGIRRSAMIALFSPDDGEMMYCKARPDWHKQEPWLGRANNSVAFVRGEIREDQFRRVFEYTRQYGEPGFALLAHRDHGLNPCAEIGLDPRINGETGWAFCNLSSINCAANTTREEMLEAARAAAFIGTLQAAYTDFPYLGSVTEAIARRDALIGVSMTGMQDNPSLALDPEWQNQMSAEVLWMNETVARQIKIKTAARATCVKPEGTGSLTLYGKRSPAVSSGHHRHCGRRFIRRVTAEAQEPPFQAFRAANPHMCERKPDGNWVVSFPIQVGEGAPLMEDQSAVQFLDEVRSTQQNWVVPGTGRPGVSPGLRHNVSSTCPVRAHEWGEVANYLWKHRDDFTAVSFLPYDASAVYDYAPFEPVVTDEQDRHWRKLAAGYVPVDYSLIREDCDATNLKSEAACAGGKCEWSPA